LKKKSSQASNLLCKILLLRTIQYFVRTWLVHLQQSENSPNKKQTKHIDKLY
jgi:hypothetical protein